MVQPPRLLVSGADSAPKQKESLMRVLRTTILGGALFLAPFVILLILLGKALEITRGAILAANLKEAKNLRNLLPLLSNLIARLYLNTETENKLWGEVAASRNNDSLNPAPTQ